LDATPVLPEYLAKFKGLRLIAIDLSRMAIDHSLVVRYPGAFAIRHIAQDAPIDPRKPASPQGEARARLMDASAIEVLEGPILDQLLKMAAEGMTGLRLINSSAVAPAFVSQIAEALRRHQPGFLLIGDMAGAAETLPFDFVTMPVAGAPPSSGLRSKPLLAELKQGCGALAVLADGLIVSAGLLQSHPGEVATSVAFARQAQGYGGEIRSLSSPGAALSAYLRADTRDVRIAGRALLVLTNMSQEAQPEPGEADLAALIENAGADFHSFLPLDGTVSGIAFRPGETRLFVADRAIAIRLPAVDGDVGARAATMAPRLVIEDISPHVSDGNFAAKRVVGEHAQVRATVYADGHEQLAAELLHRAEDDERWTAVRMAQLPNDRWSAAFALARLGRHLFAVEAWLDRFGGFRRDFAKKLEAGVAQVVDQAEGLAFVREAAERSTGDLRTALGDWIIRIHEGANSASLLLSPDLAQLMETADDRPHRLRSPIERVDAERLQARFSSWYELFPRSMSGSKDRHGNFADVIDHLPRIRDMGFDTLYFPPIHPIGTTNRKGPNNTLTPAPGDPGSPYAIGSVDGGHDVIHPELGTFEDFAGLISTARDHGLEIAIDFAIQCSPDHPWLKKHPGWFAWRSDGSMKYAENPPKKYQDIVNVDFYAEDAVPDLWLALRDVVLLWVGHGVKTFRVDNPHTKPLPFWEWMIGEVRSAHPDTIFLAEAFTRPAMMYRLAKIGFSQSYTYFTWRDGKQELIDYITELTTTAPKDFYRPHFFVNTPDINPPFLQISGRSGFRIRAVLAATLSGLFGVYSGFELCESAALPGREEYLDSEKYELRPRDWHAPGNIVADITLLNRLRRAHPALQTHLNTRFLVAHNDSVIYYAKPEPDGAGMILVMVSLDPHGAQEVSFEVPLWEFGLPDDGSVAVEDLAAGHRFRWYGKNQRIRLDPDEPYRIWRIAPGDAA
jgi:starch synthase (maltosyl-transferring)